MLAYIRLSTVIASANARLPTLQLEVRYKIGEGLENLMVQKDGLAYADRHHVKKSRLNQWIKAASLKR